MSVTSDPNKLVGFICLVSCATCVCVWGGGGERSDRSKQFTRSRHTNNETHSVCQKIKYKAETKVLESSVYEPLEKDEKKKARFISMFSTMVLYYWDIFFGPPIEGSSIERTQQSRFHLREEPPLKT
jgi:hypothetical protein